MPQPVYLICSALTADDGVTGSVSCLHILDTLQTLNPSEGLQLRVRPDGVGEFPGGRLPFPLVSLRILSNWMKTDDDDSQTKFEVENAIIPAGLAEQAI